VCQDGELGGIVVIGEGEGGRLERKYRMEVSFVDIRERVFEDGLRV